MAKLSPVLNDAQFDSQGNFLVGGKIYTYIAGSTTPTATFTTAAGNVQQSNPIILNAEGRVDDPIWLSEGQTYKLRLFNADNTFTGVEFDNIVGVGDDLITTIDQWIVTALNPTYIDATTFTIAGDQTSILQVGRRLKISVTGGTVFATILTSVYTTLTTVTITPDSGSLDAGISDISYGIISSLDTSLPQIDNFVKTSMIQDEAITLNKLDESALGISMLNGYFTASVASNALTVAIKTFAGTDPTVANPVMILFRDATQTNGNYVSRKITAATSFVVSSGSTLGTTSAVQAKLSLLAIDNAGTVELAIVNDTTLAFLDNGTLISTTAEGGAGAADSAGAAYSTTARSNVPYRIIGQITITEATAGTWATAPSLLQLSTPGMLANNVFQATFGKNQSYGSNLAGGTRFFNTNYTNTDLKPRFVSIGVTFPAAVSQLTLLVDGHQVGFGGSTTSIVATQVSAIVMPGSVYNATNTSAGATGTYWHELTT